MVNYQWNDIVRLTDSKFEELKGKLWFSDNTFVITGVDNDGMVKIKELDEPVAISDVMPVTINKKNAGNIYYDPIIAASIVRPGDEIPAYSTDYSYFMDHFERVLEMDGTTFRTRVEKQKFKYVHELQNWMRETCGSDDLKIHHKIITLAEVQYRNLWNLRPHLLEAGVSSYQFLYEMANMLYLRWMAFHKDEEMARWKELEQASGEDLVERYHQSIQRINQQTRIYSAPVLEQAIKEVTKCAKPENISVLFDLMLQENSKAKDGGALQNSTPQVLAQLLVEVMQPKLGECWHDPAAGFSGFLVGIDKYLREHNDKYQSLSKEEKAFQITEALSGMEIQKEIARIGFCNTRFHGLWCKVINGDSLATVDYQRYDGIICEPPIQVFALASNSNSGSKNRQTAFVDLILNSLSRQQGSRAAILLPESFLYKSSSDYRNTRRRLFENFDVHTILRLPKGIYPSTASSMCALFINGGLGRDRKVLVYDMQKEQLKPEKLQSIATYNGFIKTYRSRVLDKRSQYFSLDELKDDYAINFGGESKKEPLQIETPSHYLMEANKIVKDIRGLLSKMGKEINGSQRI